jgi:hypothetical protein
MCPLYKVSSILTRQGAVGGQVAFLEWTPKQDTIMSRVVTTQVTNHVAKATRWRRFCALDRNRVVPWMGGQACSPIGELEDRQNDCGELTASLGEPLALPGIMRGLLGAIPPRPRNRDQ